MIDNPIWEASQLNPSFQHTFHVIAACNGLKIILPFVWSNDFFQEQSIEDVFPKMSYGLFSNDRLHYPFERAYEKVFFLQNRTTHSDIFKYFHGSRYRSNWKTEWRNEFFTKNLRFRNKMLIYASQSKKISDPGFRSYSQKNFFSIISER